MNPRLKTENMDPPGSVLHDGTCMVFHGPSPTQSTPVPPCHPCFQGMWIETHLCQSDSVPPFLLFLIPRYSMAYLPDPSSTTPMYVNMPVPWSVWVFGPPNDGSDGGRRGDRAPSPVRAHAEDASFTKALPLDDFKARLKWQVQQCQNAELEKTLGKRLDLLMVQSSW